ncbi:hypothetical protein KAR91_50010 [Candidatus Pacearchaeota archaeon]|nr:hypothetical protein [Candidatus Pacearchaeota archaeon]
MTGKRYYAAGGIRHRGETLAYPFAVIFGPSGQCVQVPPPKGYIDDNQFTPAINERIPTAITTDGSNNFGAGEARGLASYEMTFSHVQVEWFRNHLTNCCIDGATQGRNVGYAFQPYGQPTIGFLPYSSGIPLLGVGSGRGLPHINSFPDTNGNGNFNPTANIELQSNVMMDGFNWMNPFYYNRVGFREMFGFKRMPGGGLLWIYKTNETETYYYGMWEAKFPYMKFMSETDTVSPHTASVGSGWKGEGNNLNQPNITTDATYTAMYNGNPGGVDQYCGVRMGGHQQMTNLSTNIHDIVYHKGHMYAVTQYNLMCVSPGGKMQVLNDERAEDGFNGGIATRTPPTNMSNYTARREADAHGGPGSRSLASYKGELYMLNNRGSLFLVRPGGIREISDLTEIGTFSASGIFGGSLANNPLAIGAWGGSSSQRCKLITYNGQLHAFLNFTASFNLAKSENANDPTVGRGIFWATSHDGVTWSDRSSMLPASGIIKPSGTLGAWLVDIAPYRFSGTPGAVFPSGVLGNGENTLDYPNTVGMAGPSGFSQDGILHTWASGVGYINTFNVNVGTSGVLLDDEGTSFDQLRVPLSFTRRIRSLYPTFVVNPASYGFINAASGRVVGIPLASGSGGVYSPSGVGASGYDYTGCRNYHVSAFIDEIDDTMKVSFSEDFQDGGTLVLELNKASGWRTINHVRDSKQLNGLVPIDLYDPEVIIPSGSQLAPNPSHDPINKRMTVEYEVFDWPFWRTINVEVQYSTDDGITWNDIRTIKNISTGNQTIDPSGVLGNSHTFVWDYTSYDIQAPLSPTTFYPGVQIRMRGRDANFTNPV